MLVSGFKRLFPVGKILLEKIKPADLVHRHRRPELHEARSPDHLHLLFGDNLRAESFLEHKAQGKCSLTFKFRKAKGSFHRIGRDLDIYCFCQLLLDPVKFFKRWKLEIKRGKKARYLLWQLHRRPYRHQATPRTFPSRKAVLDFLDDIDRTYEMVKILNEQHGVAVPTKPPDRAQGIQDILDDFTGLALGNASKTIPRMRIPALSRDAFNRP